MHKFRFKFSKTGRAAYISHLDTMRTFQRAIARAKLPAKHTEGFNPHAYISIALPLSLGYTSDCEYMDLVLLELLPEKEIVSRMNAVLPDGVRLLGAYEQKMKAKEISAARFDVTLEYDSGLTDEIISGVTKLLNSESIIVLKKSKRGEVETDIAPMIRDLSVSAEGNRLKLDAVLAAGNTVSLNPDYLLRAIERYAPRCSPDFAEFHRTEVLCENGEVFC